MNKFFLLIPFALLFSTCLFAQNKSERPRYFHLYLKNEPNPKGYILGLNETSILFQEGISLSGNEMNAPKEIPIEKIWKMKARKKGRINRSVWIGAGTGFLLGALGSYVGRDDFADTRRGQQVAVTSFGLTGALYGAGIGWVIGISNSKTFRIKRSQKRYEAKKKKLETYILKS